MYEKKLIKYLSRYITEERNNLFDNILEHRTRYITVVLEDIFQSQNASAVLRTCDCFGIQDVHVIENKNAFNVNPNVVQGASKWLTLYKYNQAENNSLEAISLLKNKGYRIVATSPGSNDSQLENFDLTIGKTALVFGSEKPGISETVKKHADEFLQIPMYGFTESFNLSVSAAIILHYLTLSLRKSSEIDWKLTPEEKITLKLDWIKKTIKRGELLEQEFREKLFRE